jgi:P-type Cu+ transporter
MHSLLRNHWKKNTVEKTLELPVKGMDCAECTRHVKDAISSVPGVYSAEVYLAAEKAVIRLDEEKVNIAELKKAVEMSGYSLLTEGSFTEKSPQTLDFTRQILTLFGIVFGFVLFIVVAGEWFGLIDAVTEHIPFSVGLIIVLIFGYPVFLNVARAVWRRQIIAHTLMTVGVLAALAIGEWATAAVVVFFMRAGDYAERYTTERARRAVKDLASLAPQTARVEVDGQETLLPVEEVRRGEIVIVRPGEKIPVDGEVTAGQAMVNQAAITGEPMPVDASPGVRVFAASHIFSGSIRVKVNQSGPDTTFGRVIKMVEEAEGHRGEVQRLADRFSTWYLPIVAGIAALTFIFRGDPLATAAVLVVACSCAFALATPIAMLASIGAGAKQGILIKGGKYLEALAKADILLIDKTGTLTLGLPHITEVIAFGKNGECSNSDAEQEVLLSAASAEKYSEHPLAEAVRKAALENNLNLSEPEEFESLPGIGIKARINGSSIMVGSRRMLGDNDLQHLEGMQKALELEKAGRTLLFVTCDDKLVGLIAAEDTLRPEVPSAFGAIKKLGLKKIELLTGDNERAAGSIIERMEATHNGVKISYQANLLPEDKIRVVKEYQAKGHTVVMVGDGINDAPALAQADIGIAMGAAGTDVANEAAHISLMNDDWSLVPAIFNISRRTMHIVKLNIGFTAVYNLAGLSLAAFGYLPPIFAAAAQSLPDLGILANSSRLLRQK